MRWLRSYGESLRFCILLKMWLIHRDVVAPWIRGGSLEVGWLNKKRWLIGDGRAHRRLGGSMRCVGS